jgi:hypothetical protein
MRKRSTVARRVVAAAHTAARKHWGEQAWTFRLSREERRAYLALFLLEALNEPMAKHMTVADVMDAIALAAAED